MLVKQCMTKMQPLYKILLYVFVIAIIIGACIFGWSRYNDWLIKRDATTRANSELIIKQLEKRISARELEMDSTKKHASVLQIKLDYQETHPAIIIQKYETIHNSIDDLNATNAVALFTSNIAKFNSNRDRYFLKRFDKNN